MFPTVRRSLLLQLDGKLPNLALMRLSAFLKQRGEAIEFRRISSPLMLEHGLFDEGWTSVYASLIFERTRPIAERLRQIYPGAIIGGTGWDRRTRLEQIGVTTQALDYSLYPDYPHSIGFSQRGCRLRCPFCVVPDKEGRVTEERAIEEIWRGDPYPRNVLLLDNDFLGAPQWRERVEELRALCANMTETPAPPAITDLSGGGEMRHHGRRFEAQWRFPHSRVGGPGAEGGRA